MASFVTFSSRAMLSRGMAARGLAGSLRYKPSSKIILHPTPAAFARQFSIAIPRFQKAIKRFTTDHEYAYLPTPTSTTVTIGITSHAASSLGDIVYLELLAVDSTLQEGEPLGTVESVKSASDILSPVTGTIVKVNTKLLDQPGLLTEDTAEVVDGENAGWLVKVETAGKNAIKSELEGLMGEEEYKAFVKGQEAEEGH